MGRRGRNRDAKDTSEAPKSQKENTSFLESFPSLAESQLTPQPSQPVKEKVQAPHARSTICAGIYCSVIHHTTSRCHPYCHASFAVPRKVGLADSSGRASSASAHLSLACVAISLEMPTHAPMLYQNFPYSIRAIWPPRWCELPNSSTTAAVTVCLNQHDARARPRCTHQMLHVVLIQLRI